MKGKDRKELQNRKERFELGSEIAEKKLQADVSLQREKQQIDAT